MRTNKWNILLQTVFTVLTITVLTTSFTYVYVPAFVPTFPQCPITVGTAKYGKLLKHNFDKQIRRYAFSDISPHLII